MQRNVVKANVAQRTIAFDAHKAELHHRTVVVFPQTQRLANPLVALVAFALPKGLPAQAPIYRNFQAQGAY